MRSDEIRAQFLQFFAERGHTVVPSSSLVPAGDPTLLFTNAGMVQFKDVFLGRETRPYVRACSAQKVVRAGGKHNDLDEVGRTARHQTFFEMLGNFSFGDYFKREAIAYAWEFLTQNLGLDPARLWITVYEEDDEARRLWQEVAHVPPDRIIGMGAKDNFWQMGETGPCGPCSEIHIDRGEAHRCNQETCFLGVCDCDRWLELWNLVFMQYDRDASGRLTPLPKPSIDTGMGLERIASVLQGVESNFETDLFRPLMEELTRLTGRAYDRGPDGFAFRVLADHARSGAFLIADGVLPANEGRGYVLRRILRRAIRIGREIGDGHELSRLAPVVVRTMEAAYPELRREEATITRILQAEEDRFLTTLEEGNARLEAALARTAPGGMLSGEEAFVLYDTYGFPLDLTEEIARGRGVRVDRSGFDAAMAVQRARSRAARAGGTGEAWRDEVLAWEPSHFVGYETLTSSATVRAVWDASGPVERLTAGESGYVLIEPTPFYAEGGGQVGDQGVVEGFETRARVVDTQKVAGRYVSRVEVEIGSLGPGDAVVAQVDRERREGAMRNHTGTHILHEALREVLGTHVRQTGSLVAPERLRFDFSHPAPLTREEIARVEELCNRIIEADLPVDVAVRPLEEARASGALMFFDEKYGSEVRVVSVGNFSRELCGGTHCARSGQIGMLKIVSEQGIGSGIRRVEAVTGLGALHYVQDLEARADAVREALGVRPGEEVERAGALVAQLEVLVREVRDLRRGQRANVVRERLRSAVQVDGFPLWAAEVEAESAEDLRAWVDAWKQEGLSGICILGARKAGWAGIVVAVTGAARGRVDAGAVLRRSLTAVGGRGGGRPDLAQGGVPDPARLEEALAALRRAFEAALAEGGDVAEETGGKRARRAE